MLGFFKAISLSYEKVMVRSIIDCFYNVAVTLVDEILLVALVTCKHNTLQGNFITFWLGLK